MKVAFIFEIFIALVSISLSNGFVAQNPAGNSSQEIKPEEKQAPPQKEVPIKVDPKQPKEKLNQNEQDQAKNPDPGLQQNKNQSLNLNQQDLKKNQQLKEIVKTGEGPKRRSFTDDVSIYKRFEVRKRSEDTEAMQAEHEVPKLRSQNYPQELESIIMAVDTGAKPPIENKFRAGVDPVDRIEQMYQDITKTRIPSSVIYRAKQDLDVKPSFIRFRSSQQPSLKLEVTTSSIVKALETLLSNPEARRYADVIAQQAAVMFRSMSDKKPRGVKRNLGNNGYEGRSLYNRH